MHRVARPGGAAFLLQLQLLLVPPGLDAQGRLVVRHRFEEQEGRLMAFYSSALAYTPLLAPTGTASWVVDVGIEGSFVPWLSTAQRRVGSDKPEATNLLPVLPRPRAALTLPQGIRVDLGWMPPLRAFGVQANMLGIGVSRTMAITPSIALTPRISALAGLARAAITCYADLGRGDKSHQVYYAKVCYGRESDDRFEPRHLSGELVATVGRGASRLVPYAGAGVRAEHTRFDIGVIRDDGTRDQDNPILELRATRGYGFAGASWVGGAARLTGELYYAPGSLVTGRVLASLRLRER